MHKLGEFRVVLMADGSNPGQTRTTAIALYDRVQAFNDCGAGLLAAPPLGVSPAALPRCRSTWSRAARRGRPPGLPGMLRRLNQRTNTTRLHWPGALPVFGTVNLAAGRLVRWS